MVLFNNVQMKCYVLLKLIKNEIINKEIGEETLTSYHCKTCMFYMLENTSEDVWISENLASCLLMCLRQLRLWAMNGNCPNYFIPGENMFNRITSEDSKLKLFELLDIILNSDMESLIMRITADEIGKRIRTYGQSQPTVDTTVNLHCCRTHAVLNVTIAIARSHNDILYEQYSNNLEIFNENIRKLFNNLWQNISYTDHTTEERTAKSLITPFLQLTLLTNSSVMQLRDGDEELRTTLESEQWDELDVTGISKLKQASIYLALNESVISLILLLRATQGRKFSFCSCDPQIQVTPLMDVHLIVAEYDLKDAVVNLLRKTLLPCVSFLPCEELITPCAIRYEMIRCFGMPSADRAIGNFFWFNWGIVDGRFFYHISFVSELQSS